MVQRWWKLNEIEPEPIKVSKHSLVTQVVVNIWNSKSDSESINLSEIEGETNNWLDDLEEWELKIIHKFKETNTVEATEVNKICEEERKVNILLRAVQFEANTVKKVLYSGGKSNEFDPNFVKLYIAWYQNHDEYYYNGKS